MKLKQPRSKSCLYETNGFPANVNIRADTYTNEELSAFYTWLDKTAILTLNGATILKYEKL